MTRIAALLRGVNVGGRNRVAMGELRTLIHSLGYDHVETYLQSGNAVFGTPSPDDGDAARQIEGALAATFGLEVTVFLRTHEALSRLIVDNPFAGSDAAGAKLHVVFLQNVPPADRIADLDPDRSRPDAFEVLGREIYVHYPNGSGRSKLNGDYFERTLGMPMTARNWNTVTKLADMTAS